MNKDTIKKIKTNDKKKTKEQTGQLFQTTRKLLILQGDPLLLPPPPTPNPAPSKDRTSSGA